MQYDITRNTFRPAKQYSRVLMRQGAVLLDADFNEQQSILLHYMRALAKDLFGPHAGPNSNPGFEIVSKAGNWEARLNGAIADSQAATTFSAAVRNGDMLILPGRYYVDGILVENETGVLYSKQLGYSPDGTLTPDAISKAADPILVYLEVWERLITFVQDDDIREVALGGPDTCARTQVSWRVKAQSKPNDIEVDRLCEFFDTHPPVRGTLRARVRPGPTSAGPCVIAADARYRGAENQLYRVEIHRGGAASGDATGATFKWSRENGAVVFAITSFPENPPKGCFQVEVETIGRDRRFGLEAGDWVEVVNDRTDMSGVSGPLFEVEKSCGDSLIVTLTGISGDTVSPAALAAIAGEGKARHPLLRRWDHRADSAFAGALPVTAAADETVAEAGWIDLEDGVQVRFSKGAPYRAGDYWLIPARVATGQVEWPEATGTAGVPALPPHGPHYHYAPLLVIETNAQSEKTAGDCRCRIVRLPCLPQGESIVAPAPTSNRAVRAPRTPRRPPARPS